MAHKKERSPECAKKLRDDDDDDIDIDNGNDNSSKNDATDLQMRIMLTNDKIAF